MGAARGAPSLTSRLVFDLFVDRDWFCGLRAAPSGVVSGLSERGKSCRAFLRVRGGDCCVTCGD